MIYVKAISIIRNLGTEQEEKDPNVVGEAIKKILSMETINAVRKDDLRKALEWCVPWIWE